MAVLSAEIKQCFGCKAVKPVDGFGVRSDTNKPMSRCRPCSAEYAAAWRRANPDKVRIPQKQTYQKRKALLSVQRIERKYGLTDEDYKTLLANQNHGCAICGRESSPRRFAVDHDHSTGAIRGLLCMPCNTVLGHMRDNPQLLRQAADYLEVNHGGC